MLIEHNLSLTDGGQTAFHAGHERTVLKDASLKSQSVKLIPHFHNLKCTVLFHLKMCEISTWGDTVVHTVASWLDRFCIF